MFTYFKKKQQQSTDKSQQKPSTAFKKNKQQNDHSQENNKESDNVFKLPSDIMTQLMNQNSGQQNKKVKQTHQKQSIKQKLQKVTQSNQIDKRTSQLHPTVNIQAQIKTERKLSGQSKVKSEEVIRIPKINDEKVDKTYAKKDIKDRHQHISLVDTSKLDLLNRSLQDNKKSKQILKGVEQSTVNTKMGLLSNKELEQLTSAIIDILSKTIQSQLTGQQVSAELISEHLLPSTLSIIQQLNSSYYESFILQTKEKYNQLVDQSTNLYSKSRQIANLVNEFVLSINLFFQSQELLIPAEQIHKAIAELNPQKTQKYVNYLIRIFQSNFDEVIEKRIKQMKSSLQSQLRKSQKQNKQLDLELKRTLQNYQLKQSIFTEQQTKFSQKQSQIISLKREINELNMKLNSLSSLSKQTKDDYQSQLLLLKRQIQRSKKEYQESKQKISKLQKISDNKDKLIQQKQQEIQKLGEVIKKVKQTEYEGMENIVQELQLKEKMFQDKIQRFSVDKINLQNKIRTLSVQKQSQLALKVQLQKECQQLKSLVDTLKQEIKELKENSLRKNSKQISNESVKQSENDFEQSISKKQQKEQQKVNLSKLVNKEILGHLFLSFEDESKQWTIRNNIRNQIYILLDIKKGSTATNAESQNKNSHALKQELAGITNKQQPKKSKEGSIIGKWLGW